MWVSYAGDIINLDRVVQITDGLSGDKLGGDPQIRFYTDDSNYFAYTPNDGGEEVARVLRNLRRVINPVADVALGKPENRSIKDLEEWS